MKNIENKETGKQNRKASNTTMFLAILIFIAYILTGIVALFGLSLIVFVFGFMMKPDKKKKYYKNIPDSCRHMKDLEDT